jgi:hypothetical protein
MPESRSARLLYGSGTRLIAAMRLRIEDVDFARRVIVVRDGKGDKDRALNRPGVEMPNALVRKYPNGGISWRTAAGTVASPLDSLAAHA